MCQYSLNSLFNILREEADRIESCFEVAAEKINERDELLMDAFEERDKKIDAIARTLFFVSCMARGEPVSKQYREGIWQLMGYEWTAESEKALKDACMKQALWPA